MLLCQDGSPWIMSCSGLQHLANPLPTTSAMGNHTCPTRWLGLRKIACMVSVTAMLLCQASARIGKLSSQAPSTSPVSGCMATLPDPAAAGWRLAWEDEFDGPELNATTWNVRHNESHCCPQEPQLYLQENVQVMDGFLRLTTQRQAARGPRGLQFNWTSGWVDTKGHVAFQQGRWDVRARLPAWNATGAWPAHWLLPEPSDVCWPTGGEIDILEAWMEPWVPATTGTLRWGTTCGNNEQVLPGGLYPPNPLNTSIQFNAGWHTFTVVWNASALTFAVDNCVYHVQDHPDAMGVLQYPMYFIADTAISYWWNPGASAVYPAVHDIDSVRVWQPPTSA